MADQSYSLGGKFSKDSYLRKDKIIEIALESKAEGIHPGYGFLSENCDFVQMVEQKGLTFIGPPSTAIAAMGSKIESKTIMEKANVPVVPGWYGDNQDVNFLFEKAKEIKFPIMIKADLGGGGKGMRIVNNESEFFEALESAKNEGIKSFGSGKVLMERYIRNSKHIEVQVFGDKFGNYVHMFERDCTIQRRHQKVIEEAPSFLDSAKRTELCEAAVQAARAVGYYNAGTVEFIYDIDHKQFFFMEMNTRLQVEHPISEEITKEDFVEWQLRIASGQRLPKKQTEIKIHGHAMEARIYSEDPKGGFLPGSGKISFMREPGNRENGLDLDTRVETGIRQGDEVSIFYDPMIAKLVVWGEDRAAAILKMHNKLREFKIHGLPTNLAFCQRILGIDAFKKWNFDTNFISNNRSALLEYDINISTLDILTAVLVKVPQAQGNLPWNNNDSFRLGHLGNRSYQLKNGKKVELLYTKNGRFSVFSDDFRYENVHATVRENEIIVDIQGIRRFKEVFLKENENVVLLKESGENLVVEFSEPNYIYEKKKTKMDESVVKSPMHSTVSKLLVKDGDVVEVGQTLLILEAMKMEHVIKSGMKGKVAKLNVQVGDFVEAERELVELNKI